MIDVKLAYLDRSAARASIEVMQWDFDQMILSHGHLIYSGAKEVVYQAYRFLLKEGLSRPVMYTRRLVSPSFRALYYHKVCCEPASTVDRIHVLGRIAIASCHALRCYRLNPTQIVWGECNLRCGNVLFK